MPKKHLTKKTKLFTSKKDFFEGIFIGFIFGLLLWLVFGLLLGNIAI